MTISELVAKLQEIQEKRGDLRVLVYDDEFEMWTEPKPHFLPDDPVWLWGWSGISEQKVISFCK